MIDYAEDLRNTVTEAAALLAAVPDEVAARRPGPGKWSAKEIVGHLVDSASNNHQRFVRAQFQEDLVFAGYAQDEWVAAQRYQDASWPHLLTLWHHYNLHIAHVIEVMPADRFATLDALMRDYVAHLHHHLRQLRELGVLTA
jgi:DinB family protein